MGVCHLALEVKVNLNISDGKMVIQIMLHLLLNLWFCSGICATPKGLLPPPLL